MMTIAWVLLLLMASSVINDWLKTQHNPNRQPVSQGGDNGERRVQLKANRQHQYLVGAHINGFPVTLLVDTGATDVVVPQDLATRLNLPEGPSGYAITANGRVRITRTRIEQITIGSISLHNVPAAINPGMGEHDAVLLGMSALNSIELRQRDGELVMIQNATH